MDEFKCANKIVVNEIGATSSALLKGSWRDVAWNKAFKLGNLLSKRQCWSFDQHLNERTQMVLAMSKLIETNYSISKQV